MSALRHINYLSYTPEKAVNYPGRHFELLDFEYFTEVSKGIAGKEGEDLSPRQSSVYPEFKNPGYTYDTDKGVALRIYLPGNLIAFWK